MKIVFFTDFYRPDVNGVSAAVELTASGLRTLGHQVYIVAPAAAKPTPDDHPDVIRLPSTPGVWYKDMRDGIITPKFAKRIKELNADIYHFHTNGVTGIGGMRLMFSLNMPAVAHYHTDYEEYAKIYRGMWAGILMASLVGPLVVGKQEHWPESLQGVRPRRSLKEWNDNMVRNLIRLSYEYFATVIVPSEKMKTKLQSYGVTRPIEVLPTGLDTSELTEPTPHTVHEPFELLYVGRISREKNIDVVIDTIKVLNQRGCNCHLTLVGPGPHYLTTIRHRIRDEGLNRYITVTGGVPRKRALSYYAQADAFVFPSLTDTQALVLNEAAYSGLPLIFSDPEISPYIAQDKHTGLLVQADSTSYADAIEYLTHHPRIAARLGRTAQARASQLTIAHQAKLLEKIYQQAIKHHVSYEETV